MKGFEPTITVAFAVVLLIVVVLSFYASITAEATPRGVISAESECLTKKDCPKDELCLQIYPDTLHPFCGCITNKDCLNGVCGENNKCEYGEIIV